MELNTAQPDTGPLLVFIDESGDIGRISDTPEHFVMAAVTMDKDVHDALETDINLVKSQLNLSQDSEFKFSKMNKDKIKIILKELHRHDVKIFAAVYRCTGRQGRKVAYNDILLELINSIEADTINVEVDGKVGKKYHRNTKTFIRKNVRNGKIKRFRYMDSRSSNMIQLADLVVGAIARSYTQKKDARDYLDIISPDISGIKEVGLITISCCC